MERGVKRIKSYSKYRILRLLQNGGMTVNEIADKLGLSPSTVYTLMDNYRRQYLVTFKRVGKKG